MWEKIVLNLLSNAFKFTFEGEIAVALRAATAARRAHGARHRASASPRRSCPHIFERFHRVAGRAARTHEGTGIGLALVQELVRLHGGDVAVESGVGQGSTFTVRIPRGHGAPAGRAHRRAAPLGLDRARARRRSSKRRCAGCPIAAAGARPRPDLPRAPAVAGAAAGGAILLADDNADMRDYLAPAPRRPLRVEAVPTARRRSRGRARAPDLVLTDVMMPGSTASGCSGGDPSPPRDADRPP